MSSFWNIYFDEGNKNLFSLKNRSSLIIGGAGLLGSEMSYALAELDSNLVIASRNKDKCKNIC